LRPHSEYTATDALHGQLNATAMCYQTIASPVSSTHRPKLESSPNYPCQIRPLRCRKDQPVTRDSSLAAVEADLESYFDKEPFADAVLRLGAYRGITHMGGLCLGAEVFDWRRFPGARAFMSFTGLTCSENSTGLTEHRGAITRAGNAHIRGQLCEAAWTYQHHPAIGTTIKARQAGVSAATVARAWNAQLRLSARFRALAARKNVKSVVAAAVARELAGFCWAEMTATS
jgi:transposase